jgi:hypothetical protein
LALEFPPQVDQLLAGVLAQEPALEGHKQMEFHYSFEAKTSKYFH